MAEPDDWPGPGRWIIGIARQVAPQDGAAFFRKLSWESTFDLNKSVVNELLDLRVAEHTRGVLFVGRHECPLIAGQPSSSAECGPAGRFGLDTARASRIVETRFFRPRKARTTPSAAQEENRSDM
jgi:hypothetical protein